MKTYVIDGDRVGYSPILDVLYIGYGSGGLDGCCSLEDTPSGITVMYDEAGSFAGAEIYDASRVVGPLPAVLTVDARTPFRLSIPEASGAPAKALATL